MSRLRALAILHQNDAGPGVFADAASIRGWSLETWPISELRPPPSDPVDFDAVIVLGGSANVDERPEHPWMREERAVLRRVLDANVPVLGVCLGAQLLAEAAGGTVERAADPEIGWYEVEVSEEGALDPLIGPLAPRFTAFEWHSYAFPLPTGAKALASTPSCLQAFRLGRSTWGIQFHAEVTAEIACAWIDDHHNDADAVAMELDPDALRAETDEAITGWNVVGRGICQRFLDVAVTHEQALAGGPG